MYELLWKVFQKPPKKISDVATKSLPQTFQIHTKASQYLSVTSQKHPQNLILRGEHLKDEKTNPKHVWRDPKVIKLRLASEHIFPSAFLYLAFVFPCQSSTTYTQNLHDEVISRCNEVRLPRYYDRSFPTFRRYHEWLFLTNLPKLFEPNRALKSVYFTRSFTGWLFWYRKNTKKNRHVHQILGSQTFPPRSTYSLPWRIWICNQRQSNPSPRPGHVGKRSVDVFLLFQHSIFRS